MKKQLIVTLTPQEHAEVKSTAAMLGLSIRQYVLLKLGLLQKIEKPEDQK